MKVSVYTAAFNVVRYGFDYADAFANWAVYADEISVAVNTSDDGTYETLRDFAKSKGYPVSIVQTTFDYQTDPFTYGRIVNAALQNCTGDLLMLLDLDERIRVAPERLKELYDYLQRTPNVQSLFVPNIDLYGSNDRAVKVGGKWHMHKTGLFRGAVNFGIKSDGRPDYNKTSTDEITDKDGNLVPTVRLLEDLSIESVRAYVAQGWPIVYHNGFVNLHSRAERAKWWKAFWENATGGDKNSHVTDVTELEKRHTFEHGLPLWPTK